MHPRRRVQHPANPLPWLGYNLIATDTSIEHDRSFLDHPSLERTVSTLLRDDLHDTVGHWHCFHTHARVKVSHTPIHKGETATVEDVSIAIVTACVCIGSKWCHHGSGTDEVGVSGPINVFSIEANTIVAVRQTSCSCCFWSDGCFII